VVVGRCGIRTLASGMGSSVWSRLISALARFGSTRATNTLMALGPCVGRWV
jgi:hypothetical protein